MNLTLKAAFISILWAISVSGLAYADTASDIDNHCNNFCTQNNNCGMIYANCYKSCGAESVAHGIAAISSCQSLIEKL